MNDFRLSPDERHAVYAGTLKVLRRDHRPDLDPGAKIIIGQTRGGREVVNRETGETVEIKREVRLSITLKGWHLRVGTTEWEAAVVIHDDRQQVRVLANGIGGIPKEPGLRTRWGTRVVHSGGEVKVRPKKVPTREQQKEHWTSETERGYGGRNQFEVSVEGDLVQATGVSDPVLAGFALEAEDGNARKQRDGRNAHRRGRLHHRLAEVEARGMTRAASAIKKELAEC